MAPQKHILIIVGSAPCAGEDIANVLSLLGNDYATADYMLIGLDAVENVRVPVQYFATYHPVDILPARERRAALGGNTDYLVISHRQYADAAGNPLVDEIIPFTPPPGSSALLGVLAGLKMGYNKIIVCGCPLEGLTKKKSNYSKYQKGWLAKKAALGDSVRSLSGWTKEFLGEPTRGWLNE